MKKVVKKTVVKKAQSGSSLGQKSVKAGVDKNPNITRADIITTGKQNAKAKSGGSYASAAKSVGLSGPVKAKKMKKGGVMGKCKGGC